MGGLTGKRPVVGVLVEAATTGEDDERDLGVAEDGQFIGFLEQPVPALAEGDLAARVVLDPLDLDLSSPHVSLPLLASTRTNRDASARVTRSFS